MLNEDGSLDVDSRVYGEHIGDSKADKRGGITLLSDINQIEGMSEEERKTIVNKHKVLPQFSIKEEIKNGANPGVAFVYQKLKNSIALTPHETDKNTCKTYTAILQSIEKIYQEEKFKKDEDGYEPWGLENKIYDAIEKAHQDFLNTSWVSLDIIGKNAFNIVRKKIYSYYAQGIRKHKHGFFDKKNKNKKRIPNVEIFWEGKNKFTIEYRTKNDCAKLIDKIFESREDAEQFIEDNQSEIKDKVSGYRKRFDRPAVSKIDRMGQDYRKGENITPLKLMEDFGLRAIEYGKWINDKEKVEFTNYAYDALADFATALDINFKDVGLKGTLALAFGARGSGKAVAHYEPHRKVINMTKIRGAGSLAHELGHAIDYHIKDYTGSDSWLIYKAKRDNLACLKEKEIPKTSEDINKEVERNIINMESWYDYVQHNSLKKMKKAYCAKSPEIEKRMRGYLSEMNNIINQSVLDHDKDKSKTKIKEILTQAENDIRMFGRFVKQYRTNLTGVYRSAVKAIDLLDMAVEAEFGTNVGSKKIDTVFLDHAKKIDKARSSEYWSKDSEIFARAFESYVEDTLSSLGIKSPYLVQGTMPENYVGFYNDKKIYPDGEERILFNKSFENYIETFKAEVNLTKPESDDSPEQQSEISAGLSIR